MKKSCIFLFVMSILWLLTAVLFAVEAFNVWHAYSNWKKLNTIYGNDIDIAFTEISLHLHFFISVIVFAAGLILGIFGLIGSIKRGRFTAVCMVLGGLPAMYLLCGIVESIIKDNGLFGTYAAVFGYAALYTAAAAVAFRFRKAV